MNSIKAAETNTNKGLHGETQKGKGAEQHSGGSWVT